tara:strand:+ start:223 stop:492 length:270 start_codon:yes stop_codon:yes gene_type:complete
MNYLEFIRKNLIVFLSKNLFGENIICGKFICYGYTKPISEYIAFFATLALILVFFFVGNYFLNQSINNANYNHKIIFFIFLYLWLKCLI